MSKELLVFNPLLYDDRLEKYIWISDLSEDHCDAQHLFGYLMKNNIYINGFVSASDAVIGLKMYYKRIYELNSINWENAVVFHDVYLREGSLRKDCRTVGQKAITINPDVSGDNIIIWGGGATGEKVFHVLTEAGMKVQFFVDSDKRLINTVKCGLPVCSPDVLEEDHVIIEAMDKWKQLDDEICGRYSKRFHYSLNFTWNQIFCKSEDNEKEVFNLSNFWAYERFADKKIYIYGTGAVEMAFAGCLKLLDYEFAGFLTDRVENDLVKGKYSVMRVEDVPYEEDYYIWVYDWMKSRKLKRLGLRHYFEYECAFCLIGTVTDVKFRVDINLGYTYQANGKYPGIMVYGADKESDYKIAVLGGSTTDGGAFPFKSWPLILHEDLGKQGITIYNGGVSGYTSGQEFVKLVRDCLPLKPNMVIVYDGFNELSVDTQYPFAFPYAKTVFNYAIDNLEKNVVGDYEDTLTLGIGSEKDRFDNWLSCIRNMHAISKENNIAFFSFCQPELSSKKGMTIQEKNILLSEPNSYVVKCMKEGFRKHMEMGPQLLGGYIYDLSHIFDEESDIYMDSCHVWEKGNKIIAKEIAKVILPEIERAEAKRK